MGVGPAPRADASKEPRHEGPRSDAIIFCSHTPQNSIVIGFFSSDAL